MVFFEKKTSKINFRNSRAKKNGHQALGTPKKYIFKFFEKKKQTLFEKNGSVGICNSTGNSEN